jgi:hypothetical protein
MFFRNGTVRTSRDAAKFRVGFDQAIAALSVAHADLIERDHKVLTKAVSNGRLEVFIDRG